MVKGGITKKAHIARPFLFTFLHDCRILIAIPTFERSSAFDPPKYRKINQSGLFDHQENADISESKCDIRGKKYFLLEQDVTLG
jgi:hypothetical protein